MSKTWTLELIVKAGPHWRQSRRQLCCPAQNGDNLSPISAILSPKTATIASATTCRRFRKVCRQCGQALTLAVLCLRRRLSSVNYEITIILYCWYSPDVAA